MCDTEWGTRPAGTEVTVGNDNVFLKQSSVPARAHPSRRVGGVLNPLSRLLLNTHDKTHMGRQGGVNTRIRAPFSEGEIGHQTQKLKKFGYVIFIAG